MSLWEQKVSGNHVSGTPIAGETPGVSEIDRAAARAPGFEGTPIGQGALQGETGYEKPFITASGTTASIPHMKQTAPTAEGDSGVLSPDHVPGRSSGTRSGLPHQGPAAVYAGQRLTSGHERKDVRTAAGGTGTAGAVADFAPLATPHATSAQVPAQAPMPTADPQLTAAAFGIDNEAALHGIEEGQKARGIAPTKGIHHEEKSLAPGIAKSNVPPERRV
ncbi:hypothetical protein M427DRAFT_382093 [Gonapodya prolifera JEL478]|uniref:Uncharacterized protein n=1 Tax=Gonapodya prolifera (strain JEL478) TaxID=1344416 RepID=A0A139A955_GONPJ|nr:hypothetical protein M427DRAFT_382093 [Gonapodya prolifera JEL478]|eukprot:KXS13277.1 hypothetical protein M427DRAFT_382093 [Gonapodya prolifera JEL478]